MKRSSVKSFTPWYFKKRFVLCLGVAIFIAAFVYYVYSKNPFTSKIELSTHHALTHPIQVKTAIAFLHSNRSCTGTLIHIRFILTAAHCVYGVSNVHVVLGTKSLSNEEPSTKILESAKFIIHENYTEKGYDNDIALIQLDDGALSLNKFINTLFFSSCQKVDITQNALFVMGWGWDPKNQSIDGELSDKKVTAVDSNQCNEYYQTENFKYEESKMFCTVDKIGPCHGDSGGPLLLSNGLQIGVVSAGKNDCQTNTPVRYMNVGYYANWIQNKILDTLDLDIESLVEDNYLY